MLPLSDTLNSLSSTLGNFKNVSTNITAINNLGLDSKGQGLIDSVDNISISVNDVTTLDASASNTVS
jgi:hypothetical protein